MNKKVFLLTIILSLFSFNLFSQSSDKKKVEEVIVDSYIHGLIDAKDFQKAKQGIHEDFIILGHKDSLLTKKTRDEWIQQRKKRLSLPEVSYTIVYLDIEGDAASAKIEFERDKLVAIDYIFLYKFNDNWRIVSAIDHFKGSRK
ncbi:nuclear transport factor 2 family protein [Allomuricauda sp. SCSIO 65647]|uniref:nuclear transport factor 2 family protein n=1 Tax=Allomuricauda sp. SCSIO 65647 TaxID=2908843 RepID=UPI001F286BE5|nr:nuclear transport factor 2 family protein [Muricauda sp. SCSIO 65647]UJH66494.1 nuclear transport factor 2 family protein [Muricauda sp. SCSIO 65647]